jgi:hypothetical protein
MKLLSRVENGGLWPLLRRSDAGDVPPPERRWRARLYDEKQLDAI